MVHIEGKHTSASTLENPQKPSQTGPHPPAQCRAWHNWDMAMPCQAAGFVLHHSETEMRSAWWAPRCVCCYINNQELCKEQSLEVGCATIHGQALAGKGCWKDPCLPKPGTAANISLLVKMNFLLFYLSKYNGENKGERWWRPHLKMRGYKNIFMAFIDIQIY